MPFQVPANPYPQRVNQGHRSTVDWALYDYQQGVPPGTGAWVNGIYQWRPTDWDSFLHYLYPTGNKAYPLTALITKMKKKPVSDPQFNWFSKGMPTQTANNTGVFRDAGLTIAYVGGGVVGDVIYVRAVLEEVQHFRDGHEAMIASPTDPTMILRGKVVGVAPNGNNSYIAINLLEADTNSLTSNAGTPGNVTMVIGNINPEAGAMPGNISYDPVKFTNYTQIFRTSVRMSRTAMQTKIITSKDGGYADEKKQALELHGMEREKAFLFGLPTENIGLNGKPERTTGGIYDFILRRGGFIDDFRTTTPASTLAIPAGGAWVDWGSQWLDYALAKPFALGGIGSRLGFCGYGAFIGINNAVKYGPKAQYTLTPRMSEYGINVQTLLGPVGQVDLVLHPLLSMMPNFQHSLLLISFEDLTYRYLQETQYYKDSVSINTGHTRIDGIAEEFLTECGLQLNFPQKFGYFSGVGLDRP